MLLALIFNGALGSSDEKIPQHVVETMRMGAFNQKFYEITSNYFTSLPKFSSLPAVTSKEELKEALPVSTLGDVYRRTRMKHLTGISFWSTLEKHETCEMLSGMKSQRVEDIYYASMATTYLPTSFIVLGKCAFLASDEQKLAVKFALRQKNTPENLARIMALLDLWQDKTLNFPTSANVKSENVKDNMNVLQAFFNHRDSDMFKFTRIFGEPAFATLTKTLTRRRGEAFYKDVHTTLLALEAVQIIKKRTGEILFDHELLKEFGRNLMTKFSLLVGELGNDPTETDESKIYSTLASMAILAQLKPDAMKNSLTKDDVNLPMEFFSVKHKDLPKALHEFVGKEYDNMEDIEEEMNAKIDTMINEKHDEL